MKRKCPTCSHTEIDKGRAFDGRRAYRCKNCGKVWTEGMQGRSKKYGPQRFTFQFADSVRS